MSAPIPPNDGESPACINQRAAIRGLPLASGPVPGVATRGGHSPFFGLIASSPGANMIRGIYLTLASIIPNGMYGMANWHSAEGVLRGFITGEDCHLPRR
jgi:hypothetical protein